MERIFGANGSRAEDGVPDMTVLSDINEDAINHNLRVRYLHHRIYTYTGSILVAVNPYKELDIYGPENLMRYQGRKLLEEEPHVYAISESSFVALKRSDKNQSCVISGESGAGKTETTKFILQYLCSVTSGVSTWVEQQILEANTILEAFGNAKTVRNDNSSRFGKFMQVCFDDSWHIKGCVMQDYLLEQSRITFQGPEERNYHVFYQLVAAAKSNKEIADQFHLRPAEFYTYLNQSGCIKIDGVDDLKKFDALRLAFNVLHVPQDICDGIYGTLAAILWLGNLEFADIDGENCELTEKDKEILTIVSGLLGFKEEDLLGTVLQRQINIRGNITHIPLKLAEARENRHAMAKALYSRTFAWLVDHINKCTNPGQDQTRFLGVLDIFGFENFAVNSFEQLCINYTNEKLHKFFNHYVFALEQEIYQQEEIKFSHITFTDNTECLELMEKPPRCILKLLSEECRMPKGADKSYLTKLHQEFETHANYIKGEDRRKWEEEFGINHYAGKVIYTVKGFVDKNRDTQQDVFFELMNKSENKFVSDLTRFQDLLGCTIARMGAIHSTISRGTSKGKPTVSDAFRNQLQALVDVLQSTNPWYVRCIKPNPSKAADMYDEAMVLDQLRYLGMNDIIRIRKEGFPIHMKYEEFITRYFCLHKKRRYPDKKQHVCDLMKSQNLPPKEWQIGKTKVFIRQKVYEPLEDRRQTVLLKAAIRIQALYRMHRHRKEYNRIHAACLTIQNYYRGWKQRLAFIRMRRAVIIIQCNVRGMFAREVANALREMKRIEEEQRRRERLEEERRQREEEALRLAQDEEKKKELEEAQRKVEEEMAALTNIAETVNNRLATSGPSNPDDASQGSGEGVDLDNLFSFLSTMESERHVLDEISKQMDEVADDLESEIEAINRSMGQKGDLPPPPPPSASEAAAPPPPPPPSSDIILPPPSEPPVSSATVPPPPPPGTIESKSNRISNEVKEKTDEIVPPPPQVNGFHEEKPKEPIYETIPAGLANAQARREPSYVSGPPPAGPPPAPPEEPVVELRRPQPAEPVNKDMTIDRRRRPSGQKRPSRSPASRSPLRNSRSNTRSPGPRPNGRNNAAPEDPERVERRKQRVERKLHELEEMEENKENESQNHFDMIEFAEKYFNNHERSPEGTIISTLTRKRPSTAEYLPKYELITYSRSSIIPTSHVHLYDPENINIACSIFRDLCKYCRGELKPEQETATLQTIISHGLEREELRNEIYVQCIRQVTNNPSTESLERLWLLLCLCVVAFQPGKLLHKYFVSFLQKSLALEGKLRQYVQWCLENCKNTKVSSRRLPPSSVEIAAMKKLGTIVCRFFFLDGRTKAIDVHPRDTAGDAMQKLADRLGLGGLEGWAIYESGADGDKHVKSHEYLYDVISSWETKQQKSSNIGSYGTINKRASQSVSAGENRFVFRKRLFRTPREIPSDPVQVNLLYAQAVYSVVRADEYPINEKVALQLAGLQAQVALGDPQEGKTEFYADITSYLPSRIAQTRKQAEWVPILSQAHRQYGTGKTDIVAKVWYLTCVMQFPLYGTTMFQVSYRGYWSYGNTLILGVNCDGIAMIKPDDKFILYEYRYCDIESIFLDPSDNFITINLLRTLPDAHKCFVFETKEKEEIGFLIASYSPLLASWIKDMDSNKKVKQITGEDRVRLYYNLVHSRRQLIDANVLRKPQDQGSNFFVSTLRRLNKQKLEKLRQDYGGENSETYKGFHPMYWGFSKAPLVQTLSKITSPEVEQQALQISLVILTYAGLSQNAETAATSDDQQLTMVQGVVDQCMKRDLLLNETYLQLIKQTTDHPDPNSRVNLRHWALLTLFCSVIPPTDKGIRKYLRAHLQRCSADYVSEEGKYSRYAEKCLVKALNNRRRQWAPSKQEILCTINRRPIYARFHFMDGQFHSLEFDASATAHDVVELIRHKIGLKNTAKGYAIYEMLGTTERCILAEEVLADVMSRWERYRHSTAANQQHHQHHHHHIFLFKKHLLLESWMDLSDNVEKELLYFQVLYTLRADKFPVTQMEAVMLCALRAQIELGNFTGTGMDYGEVIAHTLSPRLLTNVTHDAVAMHHQSLFNMDPQEAKQAFLNLIKSWPLHRATIFDVTQSFTSNWPKVLWLAIDENGVHLLEHRSRNVLCTYEYDYILNYSASITALMIITGSTRKQSKIILNTTQAFMIATLIKDYTEVLRQTTGTSTDGQTQSGIMMAPPGWEDGAPQQPRRSRPPSIMARPPPTLQEEVIIQ